MTAGLASRLRELRGERFDEAAAAARQARAIQARASGSARGLTWEAFSAGAPDSVASGWHDARARFREFRAAIVELLGDGPDAGVDEAAAAVYAAAGRVTAAERGAAGRGGPSGGAAPPVLGHGGGGAEGAEHKLRVRALLDGLSEVLGRSNVGLAPVERLLRLHDSLSGWRAAHGLPAPPHAGGARAGGAQVAAPAFGEGWRVRARADWASLTSQAAALAAAGAAVDARVNASAGGGDDGAGLAHADEPGLARGAGPEGAGGVDAGCAGVLWLRQAAQAHVDRPGAPAGVGGEGAACACLRLLLSDGADDALQGELFDL